MTLSLVSFAFSVASMLFCAGVLRTVRDRAFQAGVDALAAAESARAAANSAAGCPILTGEPFETATSGPIPAGALSPTIPIPIETSAVVREMHAYRRRRGQ